MTAVFAIRHPQTTWNADNRYQGRLEAPVSAEGKVQSRLVTRAFGGAGLAAVYSSPLSRSLFLAAELAQGSDAPLIIDQRLAEIGMGRWEGLYRDEIEVRYPELFRRWYSRPDEVRFPGGESLGDVRTRALSSAAEIYHRYPGCSVAVVTHSAVIQVLAASALSLDLRFIHRLSIHNASITTFCGDAAPGSLLSLNGTEPIYHSPVSSAAAQACVS